MLRVALLLLIVGLIAKTLGLPGVAAAAGFLAWAMLLVGAVRLVIRLLENHLPPIA